MAGLFQRGVACEAHAFQFREANAQARRVHQVGLEARDRPRPVATCLPDAEGVSPLGGTEPNLGAFFPDVEDVRRAEQDL
eukprot:15889245-Heterocapsa_arctica.AAC.1